MDDEPRSFTQQSTTVFTVVKVSLCKIDQKAIVHIQPYSWS